MRPNAIPTSRARRFAVALLTAVTMTVLACSPTPEPEPVADEGEAGPPEIVEATIAELQAAMTEGRVTSRQLIDLYLERFRAHEDTLNAAITLNPMMIEDAKRLDAERAAGNVRGPLHGIPVAVKDNIHTVLDIRTTVGALAFEWMIPPYEATLVTNLEEAGAIIFAKTTMTELANFMADGMPNNYSAVGGYSMNPYDPRPDPREGRDDGRPVMNTGGSSSGVGTTASLWVASVGTETSGSILSPANNTMLVGIKPTLGRISRYGIAPIVAEQDTAGPMARTVADAAALLGVLEGQPDPMDSATGVCEPPPNNDYTAYLDAGALAGARIGIPRAYYYDELELPWAERPRGGQSEAGAQVMSDAIAALRAAGAEIVDPVEIPSIVDPDPEANLLRHSICVDMNLEDQDCSSVLQYGMKRDFNAWLASLGEAASVKTLTELREYNLANAGERETMKYGQAALDASDSIDLEADRARFEADRARDLLLSRERGIDAALLEHDLDALLFPGSWGADIAARAGYPTVIVPFGMIPNAPNPPLPEGFDPKPRPMGVSFAGTACAEPRLIALAYAFEQATLGRVAPPELTPQ